MKLPKKVKVGPHTIPIGELPDSADAFGWYRSSIPQIEINTSVTHSQQADTLLHEILHAVWRDSQLSKIVQIEDLDEREEGLVRVIATQLYLILKENPDIVRFLTK